MNPIGPCPACQTKNQLLADQLQEATGCQEIQPLTFELVGDDCATAWSTEARYTFSYPAGLEAPELEQIFAFRWTTGHHVLTPNVAFSVRTVTARHSGQIRLQHGRPIWPPA